MILCFPLYNLLGQRADFLHMGDQFREETATIDYSALIIVGLIFLLFFLLLFFFQKYQNKHGQLFCNDSKKLFLDLCKIHAIPPEHDKLFLSISKEFELAEPALIFVDPKILQRAIELEKYAEERLTITRYGIKLFGRSSFQAAD